MKKIVITGPESCGKTTLVKQLALHYKTPYIPEFAREYLEKKTEGYEEADLLIIAQEQVKMDDDISANFDQQMIFLDTDLITIKIWSIEKYQRCDSWILEQIKQRNYDYYLLCKPDIPWISDPLRENQMDRSRLYRMYESALYQYKKKFSVVKGIGQKRIQNAIEIIDRDIR